MTHVARRRFVQGAIGATAWLAAPGRLVAWPAGAQPGGGLPDRYPPIIPAFPTCSTAATGTPTSGGTNPASSSRTSR